jgi:hypothetical protein
MKFRKCVISVMFLNKMKKNERSKKGSSSTADVLNKGLLNLK